MPKHKHFKPNEPHDVFGSIKNEKKIEPNKIFEGRTKILTQKKNVNVNVNVKKKKKKNN